MDEAGIALLLEARGDASSAAFLGVWLSVLAGSATLVGGVLAVLLVSRNLGSDARAPIVFSAAMAAAAGVMLLLSAVELYPSAITHLTTSLGDKGRAQNWALFLVGLGWLGASCLDGLLHKLEPEAEPREGDEPAGRLSTVEGAALHRSGVSPPAGVALSQTPPSKLRWRSAGGRRLQWAYRFLTGMRDLDEEEQRATVARFRAEQLSLKRLGLSTAAVIAVHNIPEGLATYSGALTGDLRLAWSLAIAIGIHNMPEGMAVAVPILYGSTTGKGRWRRGLWEALLYTGLAGAAEPLGAVLGWLTLIGEAPSPWVFGAAMALTAGIMSNIALKELLASALRYDPGNAVTSAAFFAGAAVMAVSVRWLDE